MIANIIYFAVFLILVFVLTIAVKAITRGVEAKQIAKEENNKEMNKNYDTQNFDILNQLKELKELHENGTISDEEFKKAKEKLIK